MEPRTHGTAETLTDYVTLPLQALTEIEVTIDDGYLSSSRMSLLPKKKETERYTVIQDMVAH